MKKTIYAVLSRYTLTLMGCAFLFGFIALRAGSPRSAYARTSGVVTYIAPHFEGLPDKHPGKLRFIVLDDRPPVFEIFVGKDPGDFSPASERLDALQTGDSITIYYENQLRSQEPHVNRHATFVDKGPEVFYEKGSAGKSLFLVMMLFCLLMMPVVIFLKKRGKIR